MATTKQKAGALALATAIAIPAEGIRQIAYFDPPGVLTVCYGSTTNVQKGKVYTFSECKERLNSDMLNAVNEVDTCQPNLPENVLAAFADAAYNLGPKVACDRQKSTAARLLSMHEYKLACGELLRWNKASVAGIMISLPGLTKRRIAERELCLEKS